MSLNPQIHISSSATSIASALEAFPSISISEFHNLHARAAGAKSTAYCPYSNFRVGCTILTADGEYIDGANVENASYPVGTCAERVAFGKAVTGGYLRGGEEWETGKGRSGMGSPKAVAVSTDIKPPASPCGMCRQFIREFCELEMPIFMFDKDGDFVVVELEQLLPMSFGPDSLPPAGTTALEQNLHKGYVKLESVEDVPSS